MEAGLLILIALIIYAVFYFTHGKYIERAVVKADSRRETPAKRLYDGVDYVPANKYVLYGHHFASIAGAGPIVGPAIALAWGWLPCILWIWFGNVFIGVVHDYLSLMASVRYDGRSIGWIAGKLMGRKATYIFNAYIWFALLLVVAAFAFVISALFSATPGAGVSALLLLLFAVITGFLMYRTRLGFKGGTVIGWIFIILAVLVGVYVQQVGTFHLDFYQWLVILLVYIIVAASLPVWVLLQPRDYLNAYILWASLAIGGAALIALALRGGATLVLPSVTGFVANVVGGQPSPFWPTVPLIIACGALSGFHSLVGSGTTSKQLADELHGLLVGYAGMETEGFLSTMVIASMAAFGVTALTDTVYSAIAAGNAKVLSIVNKISMSLGMGSIAAGASKEAIAEVMKAFAANPTVFGKYYAPLAGALKWKVIPLSYAYATNKAFGLDLTAMCIFSTLWITGFALTSLDTGTRLGRYAWQELMEPIKSRSTTVYRVLVNKWVASTILAVLGVLLAATKQFLVIWPAFAGMNQLLASLALMTIAIWTAKVQKATGLGKALVIAPAVFLWITVTIALIWYEVVVIPALVKAGKIATASAVAGITAIGLLLNFLIFGLWIKSLRKPETEFV
ncbi:MAG TPA: carbon starvation protein A [Ignisphaera aggregans]|uniref:Carbon starvation protein A n=1 Tax=Ignisphaera aggregans TaxID=334771 RepID=A0A832YWR3_9CREN|nr:carbon starvation protein A [Ignisphaera aggregans]